MLKLEAADGFDQGSKGVQFAAFEEFRDLERSEKRFFMDRVLETGPTVWIGGSAGAGVKLFNEHLTMWPEEEFSHDLRIFRCGA